MKASTQYKKRLSELLALENLQGHLPEPAGKRTKIDSARNLEDVCNNAISHTVIATWKNKTFSAELDISSLAVVCKIIAHKRKTPTELDIYLRTGEWLSDPVATRLNQLLAAKKAIDGQISLLIAA